MQIFIIIIINMESEVGIFYLELESDKFINDSYESSNISVEESIVSDDIKQCVMEGKKIIISFNTNYLSFYLKFITKKFPIYSTILNPIIIDLRYEDQYENNDYENQYEITFSLENETTIIEILNNGILKNYFRNIISLTTFCELCLIVEDIAKFIVID